LYVLHKSAAVGSIISITNPMFNTTIYAKVAGTIPANTYPDDIKVIVSPEVAAKLGAKDAKFFTRISYLK
jgi:peptidoglycan endopeptidase LytF